MRIMLDTNVLISSIIFRSKIMNEMLSAILKDHRLVLSSFVIDELKDVVRRKFEGRLAEVLRQEGFKEGIEKGKSEMAIAFAINRLTKKIGIIPSQYREKINTLDLNTLKVLNYEIDDFSSLDDVRKYLPL